MRKQLRQQQGHKTFLGRLRLAISMGFTPAIVAHTMAPPATGDIVRPKPPDIVAREPISVILTKLRSMWSNRTIESKSSRIT